MSHWDIRAIIGTDDWYSMGECSIHVSLDASAWHLSIAHPRRYPSWAEIKRARDKLLPADRSFAMVLPRDGEYVNVHPNCFHLWECAESEAEHARVFAA